MGFFCLLSLFPLLWLSLVFLFDKLGSPDPDKAAAWLLIALPLTGLVAWGAVWALRQTVLAGVDRWLEFRLAVEQEMTARTKYQLLAASASVDVGRMNSADYDFARVVVAVMQKAFEFLEANQYTKFPAKWRPWSLRSSLETAEAIGVKLSQDKANAVSTWLYERGIIDQPDGGQITKRFKALVDVRRVIDAEYGKPIQIGQPVIDSQPGNWSIIP